MEKYRLLLRLKDYDGGFLSIYGIRTNHGYRVRLIGEYGDTEEIEHSDLRAAVDTVVFSYLGVPIEQVRK